MRLQEIVGEWIREEDVREDMSILERAERDAIAHALRNRNGHTMKEVAGMLGIGDKTLYVKRKKYNLE